jgi:DNA-binding protein YbaB
MNYLDEWNTAQRAAMDRWRRKNRELRETVARITARTASRNGELGVTVNAEGKVTDIRITPQALRLGETRLASMLLDTITRAQAEAHKQASIAVHQQVAADPQDAQAIEFVRQLFDEDARTT